MQECGNAEMRKCRNAGMQGAERKVTRDILHSAFCIRHPASRQGGISRRHCLGHFPARRRTFFTASVEKPVEKG
jgi:hypothetical protein